MGNIMQFSSGPYIYIKVDLAKEEVTEADAPAETTEKAPETTDTAQPAEEKPAEQPAA